MAGEAGRMGYGLLLRRQTTCTNIAANFRSKRPAFHTPSVAFGDTFPAPRRRGARQIADRVVFMDSGEILEINAPGPFFDHPQHPRTKLFLSQILR